LIVLGLLFSYMTGIIVGGIGYCFDDFLWWIIKWIKKIASRGKDESPPNGQPNTDGISYMYDLIQYYDPAAGARLAKLSAERNMCRILIFGCIFLVIGHYLLDGLSLDYKYSFPLLAICSLLSVLFYVHLKLRSRALIKNYREIFVREEKPCVYPKKNTTPNKGDQTESIQYIGLNSVEGKDQAKDKTEIAE